MTQILLLFGLLLIVSSLIINGIFSVTRGRWEFNPDGTKYWTGKLLNRYHYWLQRHTVEYKSYGGNEWLKILAQLKPFFNNDEIIGIDQNYMILKRLDANRTTLFFSFAASKGIKVDIKDLPGESKVKNMILAAYKEEHKYKMPEWLRDPLGMCIVCMSSVFGTLLWVLWMFLAKHINAAHPTETLTTLLEIGWGFKVVLWILFCFILAYLNEVFFNINNSLKK